MLPSPPGQVFPSHKQRQAIDLLDPTITQYNIYSNTWLEHSLPKINLTENKKKQKKEKQKTSKRNGKTTTNLQGDSKIDNGDFDKSFW